MTSNKAKTLTELTDQLMQAVFEKRQPVQTTSYVSEPIPVSEPTEEDKERWFSNAEEKARDLFTRRASVLRDILKVDKRIKDASFENYEANLEGQKKAVDVCKRFADRFSRRYVEGKNVEIGLFLVGDYGTGKSHLASAILNRMGRDGFPGLYIDAVDLFDYVNSKNLPLPLPEIIQKLSQIAVLVIDELGVQSWSKAEQKRLQQIVDTRAKNRLPTILCTNLAQKELAECCGGRVLSRIAELTYIVKFDWEDHRRKNAPSRRPVEEVF